jgi:hypothetical protein
MHIVIVWLYIKSHNKNLQIKMVILFSDRIHSFDDVALTVDPLSRFTSGEERRGHNTARPLRWRLMDVILWRRRHGFERLSEAELNNVV